MERFQTLRDSGYGTTYSQTYLAQGSYAEAIASTGAEPELVERGVPAVTFVDATSRVLPAAGTGARGGSRRRRGSRPGRRRHARRPATTTAISIWSTCRRAGVRLYRNAGGVLTEAPGAIGNQADAAGVPIAAVAGDYDNDGRPDLFVLRGGGNRLLRQRPTARSRT